MQRDPVNPVPILLACWAGLMACSCSPARPTGPLHGPGAGTVAGQRSEPVREIKLELGRSVKDKPIEMHVLGETGPVVLVFAGIHGDEPESVELARRWVGHLRSRPDLLKGRRVAVIPLVNPDGLAVGTRANAKSVDCNRNFPARNWAKTSPWDRYWGGYKPASQPETRAVMRAVTLMEPDRVISIHSISDDRQCNNYDGPGQSLAKVMSAANGYPATATIGYDTPGSFGSWAGDDRKIPTVTLELPAGGDADAIWKANRTALEAALIHRLGRLAK